MIQNEKTIQELEKLTTERLLAYYKAERKRFYSFISENKCKCGCDEMMWDIYADEDAKHSHRHDKAKKYWLEWEGYLYNIKTILNSRENT